MATPVRIGRYDVLGELATGGMATLFLARVVGPSGFERPVVVKRILPHLARQDAFRHMFVDEARIAAGVRHPNVVQVQELSEADGELFLVMEYLEGESVSGLMKRLRLCGEVLEPDLAAHVVAEACAGIHAAHELTDERGALRGVVHRDVSPQNVFVTYDGHVKLLDFGVALATDRSTRTQAGELKGKFPYMSPEQWRSEPLDRRSDVFALGIVLYEVSTGRLLFVRDSPAAMMRAVCDEPVIPPSRMVDAYPAALDAVCLRALACSRDERYATALDMRRDLVAALRTLETPELLARGDAAERLATKMHELFPDRIEQKTKLLRALKESTEVDLDVPAGEVDEAVELPSVAAVVTRATTHAAPPTSAAGAPRERAAPRTRILARVAAGAGVALVTAVVALRLRPADAPPPPPPVVASAASTAGSAAAPPPIAPPIEPVPAASSASAVASVVGVRIATEPSGAHVKLGGREAGTTPLELHLERSSSALALELSLRGHRTERAELVPDRDQTLSFALARERSAPARTTTITHAAPSASAPSRSFGRFE